MINFVDPVRLAALRGQQQETEKTSDHETRTLSPGITERVSVTVLPSQSRSHMMVEDENWGWEEIRDYVVSEIEARYGAFPRDARKEAGIFKRWVAKYKGDAVAIARYAFEVSDGRWRKAPISINRFCKGSDQWFSDVILERISDQR